MANGTERLFGLAQVFGKQYNSKTMAKKIIIEDVELGNSGEVSKDKINNNFDKVGNTLDVLDGEAVKTYQLSNNLGFSPVKIPTEQSVSNALKSYAQKSDVAIGMLYLGFNVATLSGLTKPTITNPNTGEVINLKIGHAVRVLNQTDANGKPYYYQYDGTGWNKTNITDLPSDVALQGGVNKTIKNLDDEITDNYLALLSDIGNYTEQPLTPSSIQDNKMVNPSGQIVDFTGYQLWLFDNPPTDSFIKAHGRFGGGALSFAWMDDNDTVISFTRVPLTGTYTIFTRMPDGVSKLYVSASKNETLSVLELVINDISVMDSVRTIESDMQTRIHDVESDVQGSIYTTGELLTPTSTVTGKYINKDGIAVAHTSFNYDIFDVSAIDVLRIRARSGAASVSVVWFDSSGVFISSVIYPTAALRDRFYKKPVSATNAYISYVNTVEHAIYSAILAEIPIAIRVDVLEKQVSELPKPDEPFNLLKGELIGIVGDSIAANGGFVKTFKTLCGASGVTNVAIGGAMYAKDNSKASIHPQVANLTGNEKFVIIEGSTNDFGHHKPLGDAFIVDSNNIKQPQTDLNTVSGGIHQTIKNIRDKFGDVPCVIMTPLHRNYLPNQTLPYPFSDRVRNQAGYYMSDYVNLIKVIAEYYSIPVFDAFAMTMLDPNNMVNNTKYFTDGLHPNALGHAIMGNMLYKFVSNNLYF